MQKNRKNWERGEAMLIATIFFLIVSLTIILGLAAPTVRAQKATRELFYSRQSYYLAEAGMEDVVYRLRNGDLVGASETLTLNGSSATTITTDTPNGKAITSTGEVNNTVRKIGAELIEGDGVAFHYGIQIGNGGFTLANNAGVIGNIYSNGSVIGQSGSFVTGGVAAVGTISGVIIGTGTIGNAHAPTVNNSTVRGQLFCKNGTGNNKPCDTSQNNPVTEPLPIEDAQINAWKDEAALSGATTSKTFSGTDNTLGPIKVNGDVTLNGSSRVRLAGTVWVTGNLIFGNNAVMELDSSYGSGDGVIIVDGTTLLSNNSAFEGSGEDESFVMILSTNTGNNAITLQNNAGATILYAPYGTVQVSNNAGLNQVTAKTIALQNNAVIEYEQGLINVAFVNGPAGGYTISSWGEEQ